MTILALLSHTDSKLKHLLRQTLFGQAVYFQWIDNYKFNLWPWHLKVKFSAALVRVWPGTGELLPFPLVAWFLRTWRTFNKHGCRHYLLFSMHFSKSLFSSAAWAKLFFFFLKAGALAPHSSTEYRWKELYLLQSAKKLRVPQNYDSKHSTSSRWHSKADQLHGRSCLKHVNVGSWTNFIK